MSVDLEDDEREIILDALESHAYWQISEEHYRNDGFVYAPGADDPETAELLQAIDRLSVKLGGEPITGGPYDDIAYEEPNNEEESEEMPTIKATTEKAAQARVDADKFKAQPATKECAPGEHDFDIHEAYKNCTRCGLRQPFPNTRGGLLSFVEMRAREMVEIMHRKNADYAGLKGADPFANFTRVEALGICKTEIGFLTRMTDKLCRISSFVERGELSVKDESVQDTLNDLACYSFLFAAFIESKKEGK